MYRKGEACQWPGPPLVLAFDSAARRLLWPLASAPALEHGRKQSVWLPVINRVGTCDRREAWRFAPCRPQTVRALPRASPASAQGESQLGAGPLKLTSVFPLQAWGRRGQGRQANALVKVEVGIRTFALGSLRGPNCSCGLGRCTDRYLQRGARNVLMLLCAPYVPRRARRADHLPVARIVASLPPARDSDKSVVVDLAVPRPGLALTFALRLLE
eukprot:scaffold111715_cov26-Tisochrysis_lutea.AAC.1